MKGLKRVENYLMRLVSSGGRQTWIGAKAPFDMEMLSMLGSTNFRVSACYHGKFDVVWLYERLLNEIDKKSWKIILDESIRLLKEKGKLVIRVHENEVPSLPQVKRFLGRHYGIVADIDYEVRTDDGTYIWTIVLNVKRKNFKEYSGKEWSFGLLTGGKKDNVVIDFLKSIRNSENGDKHQIIIVGPKKDKYSKYNVEYIDSSYFRDDKYAEISKKKNYIIDKATNPNLLIVHDRYVLDNNFFVGFEKYGYDFDFLTVKQYNEDNTEFPSYAANRKNLRFYGQIQVNNYQHLYKYHYLNGGLVIFKTATAKNILFNDLLMWNQMEDVELAQFCMDQGLIPRMNYLSSATTIGTKEGYMRSWTIDNEPMVVLPSIANIDPSKIKLWSLLAKLLPKFIKNSIFYSKVRNLILRKYVRGEV